MKKVITLTLLGLIIAFAQGCGPVDDMGSDLQSQGNSFAKNIQITSDSFDGIDPVTIKSIVVETIDVEGWASVSVTAQPGVLYLALAPKDTWSLEFMQIYLDADLNITSVGYDIFWPTFAQSSSFYATCPNANIDTYWTTECSTISSSVAAINTNNSVAQARGYVTTKAIGAGESVTNVLNYLSCSNLKLWGRVGHGYTGGLQLAGGQILSSFPGVTLKSGIYANSCQAHNPPFENTVLNAGARFFISGDVNLWIGSSEEVFKCWWQKAKDQQNVCTAVSTCEVQTGYRWPGDHGCSGPQQTVPAPVPTPTPTPTPTPNPLPPPNPPTQCGRINAGQGLGLGVFVKSCDGRFKFVQQYDGNLVLYKSGVALWSSKTHGKPAFGTYMQGDGNLVIYTQYAQPLWSSKTHGNPGAWVAVQNDGNVVIYRSNGVPIWATNTSEPTPTPTPTPIPIPTWTPRPIPTPFPPSRP